MSNNQELAISQQSSATPLSVFSNAANFDLAQRMARALASSNLVPDNYRDNIANAMIALEMANRIGASPLAVMQNMNVIHGRPSWSSAFIIAALNSCGRFAPIRFEVTGQGDDRSCLAWTTDDSGERLEGPPVSIRMAKDEGWFGKAGSKWKTMPDLMLRYRAAAFFGRLYAPDVLMGMHTQEEVVDTLGDASPSQAPARASRSERAETKAAAKEAVAAIIGRKSEPVQVVEAEVIDAANEEVF